MTAVTATNVSHNASIPAGGNTSFGFQRTWTSGNATPTAFRLNGAALHDGLTGPETCRRPAEGAM